MFFSLGHGALTSRYLKLMPILGLASSSNDSTRSLFGHVIYRHSDPSCLPAQVLVAHVLALLEIET